VQRDGTVRPEGSGEFDRRSLTQTLALALGAALLAPGAAAAQAGAQPPPERPPGSLIPQAALPSEAEDATTLDLGQDIGKRMTAKVSINGKGPYEFVVDTGANSTVVSIEAAAALGLAGGPPARVHGIASAVEAKTAVVQDLAFGNFRATLPSAPLLPAAAMGADGILGIDVLENRQLTMDFVRDTLRIDRPGSIEWSATGINNTDVRVPARQRAGQLTLVDARAGGARMTCFIDSGAQRTVGNMALHRAIRAHVETPGFEPIKVLIRGATGQVVEGVVDYVPSMRIGGVDFSRFGMAFADLHTFALWGMTQEPAIMLGMDILRIFQAVTIDFAGREVIFRGVSPRSR
jgi:hypothetical protein